MGSRNRNKRVQDPRDAAELASVQGMLSRLDLGGRAKRNTGATAPQFASKAIAAEAETEEPEEDEMPNDEIPELPSDVLDIQDIRKQVRATFGTEVPPDDPVMMVVFAVHLAIEQHFKAALAGVNASVAASLDGYRRELGNAGTQAKEKFRQDCATWIESAHALFKSDLERPLVARIEKLDDICKRMEQSHEGNKIKEQVKGGLVVLFAVLLGFMFAWFLKQAGVL
jgi:hypothetical protein